MESESGFSEDSVERAPQKVRDMDLVDAAMRSAVCSAELLEKVSECHPETDEDERLRRYVLYALFGQCDQDTGYPLLGQAVLEWIDGKPFRGSRWGTDVLDDLRSVFPDLDWKRYVPGVRPRLLTVDGLNPELKSLAAEERRQGIVKDRPDVFAVSGEDYDRREIGRQRRETQEALRAKEADAPSDTSRYIMRRMNERPSNVFTRHVVPQVAEAREKVASMDLEDEELRQHYFKVLQYVERQPQPFYKPSERGRTDRIFPANPSALSLPKRVRDVLSERFVQVDLKSAHLMIGAALWGCQEALRWLQRPGYSIWEGLWRHFRLDWEGDEWRYLFPEFKAACKEALYSTLYGMGEQYVRGQFTRTLGDVLKPVPLRIINDEGLHSMHEYAARRLVSHPVIAALLNARDRELERIDREGGAKTATGIKAEIDPEAGVDAASVLATVAQSYEQEIMKGILLYEEEHPDLCGSTDFRVALWIHDGAAVHFTRRRAIHLAAMRERVEIRSNKLLRVLIDLEVE